MYLDDSAEKKHQLSQELKHLGYEVDDSGSDWINDRYFTDKDDSKKGDINQQGPTSVLEESSTKESAIYLAQARNLKERVEQALEDGDSALADDFSFELAKLLESVWIKYGLSHETFEIKAEFEMSALVKSNDKLLLLKATYNSVERLISLLDELDYEVDTTRKRES